jgi:hypothetical protein
MQAWTWNCEGIGKRLRRYLAYVKLMNVGHSVKRAVIVLKYVLNIQMFMGLI